MNEEQLIKQLNRINPKPSKDWQERVIKHFDNFVTPEPKLRNSFSNIFNFLKLSNMSPKLKAIISVITVVATLGAGTGTIYASDSANPGDFLYGLDKTVESIQRTFTSDPVKKTELELAIMDERVLELKKLSEDDNSEAVSELISEVEAQQLRLQERFQEMNQLRTENKIQTQEQQQVMEKLQAKIQVHEEIMNQIQTQLKSNVDNSNSEKLKQLQNKYSEETQNQNQNDGDTQNQEQEQEQNQNQNDTQDNSNSTNQNTIRQQGQN